jgi:hypothetical protein
MNLLSKVPLFFLIVIVIITSLSSAVVSVHGKAIPEVPPGSLANTNVSTSTVSESVNVTGTVALTLTPVVSTSTTVAPYLRQIANDDSKSDSDNANDTTPSAVVPEKLRREEVKVTKDNGRKSGEELDQLLAEAETSTLLVLRLAQCRANCLTKVINIKP